MKISFGANWFGIAQGPAEGWQTVNGSTFYFKRGIPETGWAQINNNYYYFNNNGVMAVGWVTVEEGKYDYKKYSEILDNFFAG